MLGTNSTLLEKRCQACKPGMPALTAGEIALLLPEIPGWEVKAGELQRTVRFKDFYQTISFVNAVAFIANREDHHPNLDVGYNVCTVRYSTHSIGGLSENDFICAAKINAL